MVERKLVVVMDSGPLSELGGIGGPIITPTRVTLSAVKKMLINGRKVYACDPSDPRNTDKYVLLDMVNVTDDNFADASNDVPPAGEPEAEPENHENHDEQIPADNMESNSEQLTTYPESNFLDPQKTDASNDVPPAGEPEAEPENHENHDEQIPADNYQKSAGNQYKNGKNNNGKHHKGK